MTSWTHQVGHPQAGDGPGRLDQLCDLGDLDVQLARALCHAVAVDSLSWVLLEEPVAQDRFLDAYRVMATWR